jgi:hypothetical protein
MQGGAFLRPGSFIIVIGLVQLYRQFAGALLEQK